MKKCYVNIKVKELGLYFYCVGYVGVLLDGVFFCDCCGKFFVEIKCLFILVVSNFNYDFEKICFMKKWGEKIIFNRNYKYYI